jgi:hypothetical protein
MNLGFHVPAASGKRETLLALGESALRGPRYDRILTLASMAFQLLLVASPDALAQEANKANATFRERFPAEQTPTQSAPQPAPETTPRTVVAKREHNVAAPVRVASTKRPRSQIVVEPRSFLDAGTEALLGERKFLDYALPPTHTPTDVVQNTGGRVGWHNSPLPGPFFPWP